MSGDRQEPPASPPRTAGHRIREVFSSLLVAVVVERLAQWVFDGFGSVVASLPGGWFTAVMVLALPASLVYHRRLAALRARAAGWLSPVTGAVRTALSALRRRLPRRRGRGRAGPLGRALRTVRLWVAGGYRATALGMAAGLVVWGGHEGVLWLSGAYGPCDSPRELQVVTAPENVHALRGAAAEFTAGTAVHGCLPYRISVGAAPSIDEMIYGFENGWRRKDARQEEEPFVRLLGIRPDAWLATSSGEAAYVTQRVNAARVAFGGGFSVARDPLVLAMLGERFDDMERALGPADEGGHRFRTLADTARSSLQMRLIHPQPGLSSAGLVAAAELARLSGSGDVARGTVFDESVSALLCRFRDPGTAERETAALLVPAHSVHDYNTRSLTAEGCPGGAPSGRDALKAFSSPDLSVLDYPFHTVSWAGQHRPEAQRVLTEFGRWIGRRGLFPATSPAWSAPRSPQVRDAAALHDVRRRIERELPRVDLHLVLDASGSMSRPPAALLLRTREAFSAVRNTLVPADRLSLSRFYASGDGVEVTEPGPRAGRDDLDGLTQGIAAREPGGRDAPISAMLAEIPRHVSRSGATVAVITDGGVFDDEPDGRAVVRALARAERVRHLYVLVLGDGRCGGGPAGGGRRAGGKRVVCAEAGQDLEKGLSQMVSTIREWS
ncbi:hypothetical protein GCM10010466_22740 [Planomonospora alba]|uniref:VWFA domain-containing protein n=1 Tax=Planomonospora alba TaxID=161354 RepID=A0ABP6N196_9ACTN